MHGLSNHQTFIARVVVLKREAPKDNWREAQETRKEREGKKANKTHSEKNPQ